MDQVSAAAAEEALRPITQGLEADGYTLRVGLTGGNQLELNVEAGEAACSDCLIPKELFLSMAEKVLVDGGVHAELLVRYPNDLN